jgi:outer membrane protein assembly factor BamB
MPRPLLIAALLASLALSPTRGLAQADTAWRYEATSDITWVRDCAKPQLLVRTKTSLVALDSKTGAQLWEKSDLPSVDRGLTHPCDLTTGLSYRGDKIVAFDLTSGERRWDASALPAIQEIRASVAMVDVDLLLLFLRTAASDRSVAAIRLSSGERVWQRDDLFVQPPAFAVKGGVSNFDDLQAFIPRGDTGLIIYVSPDGPIHLDLRTGATRWTAQALAGPIPSVTDYAGMRVIDSTLVIPREKGFVAVDTRDGQVRWRDTTLLPRRATRLSSVPAGLFVRAGADFVTVLDPATGKARWPQPLTVRPPTGAYLLIGNRYLVFSKDRLIAANLETGDTTGIAKVKFKDHEDASLIRPAGDDLLLLSRQNLFRVSAQGALLYERYYHAPGTSFLQQMGGMNPNAVYGAAVVGEHHAYFVTNEPDSSGRKGNSLLRVALADGTEAGRIWLREKAPTYFVDIAREQVLFADDRKLVAVRLRTPR